MPATCQHSHNPRATLVNLIQSDTDASNNIWGMRFAKVVLNFSSGLVVKRRNQFKNFATQVNLHDKFDICADLVNAIPFFVPW